jgi:hypothetical protein
MKEILRPDQKEIPGFKPEVGRLMIQDFYGYDRKSEVYTLSGSVLMFFEEVGNPSESWKVASLARVVFSKDPNKLFNSGLLDVRSDIASYNERSTGGSIVSEGDSLLIYREVTELSLNRFLYGMARHFKWKRDVPNGNAIAKGEMIDWYNLVRNLEGLLPEEKTRISQIYRRIMRTWNDAALWEQIKNGGKKNISEL